MAKTVGYETLTVAATAVGPTASVLQGATLFTGDTAVGASRQGGASYAFFGPLETAQVRWRDDGTAPTAAVGHVLEVGQSFEFEGDLTKISFIRTGGTSGVLPVTYYRGRPVGG